jgi:excisionase family DNA binding protein
MIATEGTVIVENALRESVPSEFYTPREIASYLRCSPGFVTEVIRRRRLRAFRLSNRLTRIHSSDFTAFISMANTLEVLTTKPVELKGSSASSG